jgi:hypothetical protein
MAKPLGSSKLPVPYGWSGPFARRAGRQRLPRFRTPRLARLANRIASPLGKLFVACSASEDERNLDVVRYLLTNPEAFSLAVTSMLSSNAAGGMMRRLGGQLSQFSATELPSVLSTVSRHTDFLDSPLVAKNVRASSFDVKKLTSSPMTIYLILPAQYIQSHARLIRLWITCLMEVMMRAGERRGQEVLFILDEVAQLGQMQSLEKAATLLRGYGVRLWFFLQSLAQLDVCFPGSRGKTLLGNFAHKQFFGINDKDTAEQLSAMVGDTTVLSTATSTSTGSSRPLGGSGSNDRSVTTSSQTTLTEVARRLVKPEEVMRTPEWLAYVFAEQMAPAKLELIRYFANPMLIGVPETDLKLGWRAAPILGIAGLSLLLTTCLWSGLVTPASTPVARQSAPGVAPAVVATPSMVSQGAPVPEAHPQNTSSHDTPVSPAPDSAALQQALRPGSLWIGTRQVEGAAATDVSLQFVVLDLPHAYARAVAQPVDDPWSAVVDEASRIRGSEVTFTDGLTLALGTDGTLSGTDRQGARLRFTRNPGITQLVDPVEQVKAAVAPGTSWTGTVVRGDDPASPVQVTFAEVRHDGAYVRAMVTDPDRPNLISIYEGTLRLEAANVNADCIRLKRVSWAIGGSGLFGDGQFPLSFRLTPNGSALYGNTQSQEHISLKKDPNSATADLSRVEFAKAILDKCRAGSVWVGTCEKVEALVTLQVRSLDTNTNVIEVDVASANGGKSRFRGVLKLDDQNVNGYPIVLKKTSGTGGAQQYEGHQLFGSLHDSLLNLRLSKDETTLMGQTESGDNLILKPSVR